MTQPNTPDSASDTLASLLRAIRRWRSLVLILAVGMPVITAVVMLFTPNKYTSVGTILVETPEGGLGSDMLGQLTAIAGLAPQVPPTEMYLAILQSDRVAMAVAERLDLATYFEIDEEDPVAQTELTLRAVRKRVKSEAPDLISIVVSATDKDRDKAAELANAFLDELEAASQTLALSRARRTRELVADALAQTRTELDSTRYRMQVYQETYGVFSIEKQTEGTLELIAELQAQYLAKKAERDAVDSYTSEGSGRLRGLDSTIEALEVQIYKLLGVLPDSIRSAVEPDAISGKRKESFFIPLRSLPGLAGEYARIFMDLKVQEAKYGVLATQLEQSKIEESQSIPSFEVLDRARPPHRKSSPKRTLTVLAGLLGGLLAGVLLAVVLDDIEQRVDDDARRELEAIVPAFLLRFLSRLSPRGR